MKKEYFDLISAIIEELRKNGELNLTIDEKLSFTPLQCKLIKNYYWNGGEQCYKYSVSSLIQLLLRWNDKIKKGKNKKDRLAEQKRYLEAFNKVLEYNGDFSRLAEQFKFVENIIDSDSLSLENADFSVFAKTRPVIDLYKKAYLSGHILLAKAFYSSESLCRQKYSDINSLPFDTDSDVARALEMGLKKYSANKCDVLISINKSNLKDETKKAFFKLYGSLIPYRDVDIDYSFEILNGIKKCLLDEGRTIDEDVIVLFIKKIQAKTGIKYMVDYETLYSMFKRMYLGEDISGVFRAYAEVPTEYTTELLKLQRELFSGWNPKDQEYFVKMAKIYKHVKNNPQAEFVTRLIKKYEISDLISVPLELVEKMIEAGFCSKNSETYSSADFLKLDSIFATIGLWLTSNTKNAEDLNSMYWIVRHIFSMPPDELRDRKFASIESIFKNTSLAVEDVQRIISRIASAKNYYEIRALTNIAIHDACLCSGAIDYVVDEFDEKREFSLSQINDYIKPEYRCRLQLVPLTDASVFDRTNVFDILKKAEQKGIIYVSDYFSVPSNKDLKENPEAIIGYKFVGDNPVKKDQKTFYKN